MSLEKKGIIEDVYQATVIGHPMSNKCRIKENSNSELESESTNMTFHAPSLALTFPPPFITPFPCRLARIKTPLITINSPNPNPRNPRNRPLLFSSSPSPSSMGSEAEIERVLWTEEEIARRVAELGAAISADFKGAVPSPVVLVGVATGAFLFLADIAREITVPVAIDFVRAESYGAGTESSGEPRISGDLKIDVEGKHVIIVNALRFSHFDLLWGA